MGCSLQWNFFPWDETCWDLGERGNTETIWVLEISETILASLYSTNYFWVFNDTRLRFCSLGLHEIFSSFLKHRGWYMESDPYRWFMESDPSQVICFGFLLVLTPSNWDELLRRLVRYLFSKSTHAHSNNRYYVPYIITWYLLLYHVHSTKRHHIPYK